MEKFEPVAVILPWIHPDGELVSARLLINKAGEGIHGRPRNPHAVRFWQPGGRVSIKALSVYPGQHDPAFALKVYTHLMPSSDESARRLPATTDNSRVARLGAAARFSGRTYASAVICRCRLPDVTPVALRVVTIR